MKVSIFTPTHNPTHMLEAATSIANQTYLHEGGQIEWLVGINGDVLEGDLHRVKEIVEAAGVSFGVVHQHRLGKIIGALKRSLCDAASGDVFLELDHDDMLAPTAVTRIADFVPDVDSSVFVYSDCVEFIDGAVQSFTFSKDYGWQSEPVLCDAPGTCVHGKELLNTKAFEPTARSFSQILYAPNHFRAWTRKAYYAAGGHDSSQETCDDHDLLCRTYLCPETRIHLVKEPLYYYRRGSQIGNTFAGTVNSQIQVLSGQGTAKYPDGSSVPDFAQPIILRDKYLHKMIEVEAHRRGNALLLDLGGGISCPSGWTSVDTQGGAVTRDVRRGLPFADSSVFAIRAFDFLEHLEPKDAAWFIGECWRVLQHGGWLLTRTPSDNGVGASCDLSHLSKWNTRSWAYFWSSGLKPYRDQSFPGLRADFAPVRIFDETVTLGPWPCRWDVPYVVADLMAIKGSERVPGRVFVAR